MSHFAATEPCINMNDRLIPTVDPDNDCTAASLMPLVYDDLEHLAAYELSNELQDRTFEARDLVHEAWLRVSRDRQPSWKNRNQFFGAVAEATRRILVEHARQRMTQKRGGGANHVSLDEIEVPIVEEDGEKLIAVDNVMQRLETVNPRRAQLVKLRFYIGMNFEEAASVLGIAVPTAKGWWTGVRAWLAERLQKESE